MKHILYYTGVHQSPYKKGDYNHLSDKGSVVMSFRALKILNLSHFLVFSTPINADFIGCLGHFDDFWAHKLSKNVVVRGQNEDMYAE